MKRGISKGQTETPSLLLNIDTHQHTDYTNTHSQTHTDFACKVPLCSQHRDTKLMQPRHWGKKRGKKSRLKCGMSACTHSHTSECVAVSSKWHRTEWRVSEWLTVAGDCWFGRCALPADTQTERVNNGVCTNTETDCMGGHQMFSKMFYSARGMTHICLWTLFTAGSLTLQGPGWPLVCELLRWRLIFGLIWMIRNFTQFVHLARRQRQTHLWMFY